MQHVQAEPPPISELRIDLPPSLGELVSKLLVKDPDHRFANPTEVLDALRAARTTDLEEYWPDQTVPLHGAMNSAVTGPSAATMMLQSKLHQQRLATKKRITYLIATPVIGLATFWFGSFLGGLGATDLLASKEPAFQGVKKLDKVKEQYAEALLSSDNSRGRWEAVIEFHPPSESSTNRLYVGKAWLQLAAVFLQKRDFSSARSTIESILRDDQMPALLTALAAFQLAEIEDAADNPRAKDAAIDRARQLFATAELSEQDRDLIRQWADSRTRPTWMRELIDDI